MNKPKKAAALLSATALSLTLSLTTSPGAIAAPTPDVASISSANYVRTDVSVDAYPVDTWMGPFPSKPVCVAAWAWGIAHGDILGPCTERSKGKWYYFWYQRTQK